MEAAQITNIQENQTIPVKETNKREKQQETSIFAMLLHGFQQVQGEQVLSDDLLMSTLKNDQVADQSLLEEQVKAKGLLENPALSGFANGSIPILTFNLLTFTGDVKSEEVNLELSQILETLKTIKKPTPELVEVLQKLPNQQQQLFSRILQESFNTHELEAVLSKIKMKDTEMPLNIVNQLEQNEQFKLLLQKIKEILSENKSLFPKFANEIGVDKMGNNRKDDTPETGKVLNSEEKSKAVKVTRLGSISPISSSLESSSNLNGIKDEEKPIQSLELKHVQSYQSVNLGKETKVTNQLPVEHLQQDQNFSSELGKILIRNVKLPNGISETKIQLHPEELGQMVVKISHNQGQISAQFLVESGLSKELLEGQIQQLKQSFIQQGYQVGRVEIQVASHSSAYGAGGELGNHFNFSQQHSSYQQSKQRRMNSYTKSYSIEVEEFLGVDSEITGIDYTV
ncbi:flagellar hook-length control protein FliK [Tepidibacillus infernus]|uniref:flagellar hook-length control protein FliK n=1 Tax=Tepidibacillus infernus TaxID=1806172 RepID=UPI003A247873